MKYTITVGLTNCIRKWNINTRWKQKGLYYIVRYINFDSNVCNSVAVEFFLHWINGQFSKLTFIESEKQTLGILSRSMLWNFERRRYHFTISSLRELLDCKYDDKKEILAGWSHNGKYSLGKTIRNFNEKIWIFTHQRQLWRYISVTQNAWRK